MPDNHTEGVMTYVYGRRTTIYYHSGVMLWHPVFANQACAVGYTEAR